jgi:hypothetical protein
MDLKAVCLRCLIVFLYHRLACYLAAALRQKQVLGFVTRDEKIFCFCNEVYSSSETASRVRHT